MAFHSLVQLSTYRQRNANIRLYTFPVPHALSSKYHNSPFKAWHYTAATGPDHFYLNTTSYSSLINHSFMQFCSSPRLTPLCSWSHKHITGAGRLVQWCRGGSIRRQITKQSDCGTTRLSDAKWQLYSCNTHTQVSRITLWFLHHFYCHQDRRLLSNGYLHQSTCLFEEGKKPSLMFLILGLFSRSPA